MGLSCDTQDLRYVMQDLSLQDRFRGPEECGIVVPWPGIEPIPPAWQGRLLPAGPPGKSLWSRFVGLFGFVFFFLGTVGLMHAKTSMLPRHLQNRVTLDSSVSQRVQ